VSGRAWFFTITIFVVVTLAILIPLRLWQVSTW